MHADMGLGNCRWVKNEKVIVHFFAVLSGGGGIHNWLARMENDKLDNSLYIVIITFWNTMHSSTGFGFPGWEVGVGGS